LIAIDTSSVRRAFAGFQDADATMARAAIRSGEAALPPAVLAEALSDPHLTPIEYARLVTLPLLTVHEGYWERAGHLRASILREHLHAALPDTLIAQSCIDHDIPLITYDRDFRHYLRAGLKLV
jgi:predicted nucleic acid-binding protein